MNPETDLLDLSTVNRSHADAAEERLKDIAAVVAVGFLGLLLFSIGVLYIIAS